MVEQELTVVAAAGGSRHRIFEAAGQVSQIMQRISQIATHTQHSAQGAVGQIETLLVATRSLTHSIERFKVRS